MIPKYEAAGFELLENGVLNSSEWAKIETSWAKKLRGNEERKVNYLVFTAI